ncbi:hypothetical protein HELRODRAFT_192481 [Helobdella robusta]|uniref:SCP domain-containing protein n=1 Tax=Helobdella robusta TaxID=6412 RepID=T1FU03_HELRO|nr:hypothetical protein HELRODRAFT_192481 [Helobdella robusta]ESO00926.1 hypothetical protein HELRODRAFT_192481 [Helobdella robusta]
MLSLAIFSLWLLVASEAANVAKEVAMTESQKQYIVLFHNDVRDDLRSGVPNLVWDAKLEAAAKEWGKKCIYAPGPDNLMKDISQNRGIGQQIYKGTAFTSPNTYSDYTAMIWRDSSKIGCSLFQCTPLFTKDGKVEANSEDLLQLVCNYSPKSLVLLNILSAAVTNQTAVVAVEKAATTAAKNSHLKPRNGRFELKVTTEKWNEILNFNNKARAQVGVENLVSGFLYYENIIS